MSFQFQVQVAVTVGKSYISRYTIIRVTSSGILPNPGPIMMISGHEVPISGISRYYHDDIGSPGPDDPGGSVTPSEPEIQSVTVTGVKWFRRERERVAACSNLVNLLHAILSLAVVIE